MTITLPRLYDTLLKIGLFFLLFLTAIFISAKINSAHAIDLSNGEGDPWACHNGCEIIVSGYITQPDGTPVNGVDVHIVSVSSWCTDQCYDNQIDDITATTGQGSDENQNPVGSGH